MRHTYGMPHVVRRAREQKGTNDLEEKLGFSSI